MEKEKSAGTTKASEYYVYKCDFLRLRAKPSLEADILDKIPSGTKIFVDEKYVNKVFYKVKYNSKTGYCVKTFIEKR